MKREALFRAVSTGQVEESSNVLAVGNTREMEYSGCGCAGSNETKVTDELGHYTETKNDGRGRLIEATEPQPHGASDAWLITCKLCR